MTSVRVRSDAGFGKRLIGALLAVLGLVLMASNLWLGIIFVGAGIALAFTAQKHTVMITTAGGEVEGMSTSKKTSAERVAGVLTEAMIANRD